MSVNSVPICPAGCGGELPDFNFNFCSPVQAFGEITHIFLAASDADCFTDEAVLSEWLGRLDNSGGGIDAIRYMHVKANKPLGTGESIEVSLGRMANTPQTFTINITVDDVSDLNHEFMRSTQCSTVFKMWYAAGGYLWGGVCGVNATLKLDYQIDEGTNTIHKIVGTATWKSDFAPERVVNPLEGTILSA
jgi:hypothetical protein